MTVALAAADGDSKVLGEGPTPTAACFPQASSASPSNKASRLIASALNHTTIKVNEQGQGQGKRLRRLPMRGIQATPRGVAWFPSSLSAIYGRSEERRVGKECRCRGGWASVR